MDNLFARIPLLRILLPLIIGILLSCTQLHYYCAIGLLIFGLLLYLLTSRYKEPHIQYTINYRYYVSLFLILTSFGWINSTLLITQKQVDISTMCNSTAIAIVEEIKNNDNSMSIIANVVNHIDTCGNTLSTKSLKTKLILEGSNYLLKAGDIICYKAHYELIKNMNNPDEFDYVSFMTNKGIYYTQHLKSIEYKVIGQHKSIFTLAKVSQSFLINKVLTSNLKPNTQEFLITILLGDNKIIDQDIKDDFSRAGVAHILALSGLHVAIIMFLISIILYPLDRFLLRNIRFSITLIILIIYAFITGLSPSVVRATIMAAFFIISYIIYRKNTSLNALCGAAIFILVISPMDIFAVGFQLSFIAVASILIFSNITKMFRPRNKVIYYIQSLISVSLSSMIGTAIISAYYFNVFPLYFLIGNIIIIPLLPILLGTAILYLIFPIPIIGNIIDYSYDALLWIIHAINSIPFSSINNINITLYDIGYYYIFIATIIIFALSKRYTKMILSILVIMILWIATNTILPRYKYETGVVVFNDYDNTPILFYENSNGYLLFCKGSKDTKEFEKYNRKFLLNRGIDRVQFIPDSITNRTDIYINNPYIYIKGKRLAVISTKINTTEKSPNKRINIDYLIITKNYYGKLEKLLRIYNPALVVLSGNIYYDRNIDLKKECEAHNIRYWSIRDEGALYLTF